MPDWTPPPAPPPAEQRPTWAALSLGAAYNPIRPAGVAAATGVSFPLRGRLAYPLGPGKVQVLADLDAQGALLPGYNLAHLEAGWGFDLADGTHLIFGAGGDATRGGAAVGPMLGFYMPEGVNVALTLPLAEAGDLIPPPRGLPLPSTRFSYVRTWPMAPGQAFMLEIGLQTYRQAHVDTYPWTMVVTPPPAPNGAWRHQVLLGVWAGWAFGGAVR